MVTSAPLRFFLAISAEDQCASTKSVRLSTFSGLACEALCCGWEEFPSGNENAPQADPLNIFVSDFRLLFFFGFVSYFELRISDFRVRLWI